MDVSSVKRESMDVPRIIVILLNEKLSLCVDGTHLRGKAAISRDDM